ncbi:aldo/keto reductase [Nocardia panacis]|uniref:Aldo/keto reductase n=1 Tax=Nocardia panacis TaxID=2340916 RepID=A0A3A4KVU0_9NOCA|nr:aldo/keto reductase [Nocardia panacis]RJO79360.1 aldo/keto reductase [Nocardia panacis]
MILKTLGRIGFGSMQLTGSGHWGAADDPENSIRVLRDAVSAGVRHIDTADAYGPFTAEKYIRKALHPYPDDLLIATKGGLTRQGPNKWAPCGRPEYLRQCVEMSLRRLQIDRIGLYYLHRIDPAVPVADQLGVLSDMQTEGKIGHIGVSKVNAEQLRVASRLVTVAAVQNKYSIADRHSENILRHCESNDITFVPYAPLATGALTSSRALGKLAVRYGTTPAQLVLAWLLHHSHAIAAIPGSRCSAHIYENIAAIDLSLTRDDSAAIDAAVSSPTSIGWAGQE